MYGIKNYNYVLREALKMTGVLEEFQFAGRKNIPKNFIFTKTGYRLYLSLLGCGGSIRFFNNGDR